MATASAAFLDISCCLRHCLAVLTLVHSSLHWRTFDNTIFCELHKLHNSSSVSARSRHYSIHTNLSPSLTGLIYTICSAPPFTTSIISTEENLSHFQLKCCLFMISCRTIWGVHTVPTHNTLPYLRTIPYRSYAQYPTSSLVFAHGTHTIHKLHINVQSTTTFLHVAPRQQLFAHTKLTFVTPKQTTLPYQRANFRLHKTANCSRKKNLHAEHCHLSKLCRSHFINKNRFYP